MSDTVRADAFTPDFEGFYQREYRSVVTLVYTLTGSRHGAEDIAQDAFMKAHRNWRRCHTTNGQMPGSGWWR